MTGKRRSRALRMIKYPNKKRRRWNDGESGGYSNDTSVSLKLNGYLAEQWIKERGSKDDKSFVRQLLKAYKINKPDQLDYQISDGSSSIENDRNSSGDNTKDNFDDRSYLRNSSSDHEESTQCGLTIVNVEFDQCDVNALSLLSTGSSRKRLPRAIEDSDSVKNSIKKSDDMTCEMCQKKVVGETKRHHIFSEHFKLYIKCKLCESTESSDDVDTDTDSLSNLINVNEYFVHQSTAHHDHSLSCIFCQQRVTSDTFSPHLINVHWKELFCSCTVCDANSSPQSQPYILKGVSVGGHMLKKHSCLNPERVACATCGVVVSHFHLGRHIKAVHETARGICELCGKSFNDVDRHKKRIHTTSRCKYECETCGKKLTSKWNLTVHNRQHTGEKPFTCEMCGKSFCQKVELQLHLKTNHENPKKEKNFKRQKIFSSNSTKSIDSSVKTDQTTVKAQLSNQVSQKGALENVISQTEFPATSNVYVIPTQNVTVMDDIDERTMSDIDIDQQQVVWIPQQYSSEDVVVE